VLAPLPEILPGGGGVRFIARVKDSSGEEVHLGLRDTEAQARRHAEHAVMTQAPFGRGRR